MKTLKNTLKIIKKLFFMIFIFLIIYSASAFLLSKITINSEADNQSKDVSIYIKTNGVHTDIIVPVKTKSRTGVHKSSLRIQSPTIQQQLI
jgi:hypothetical protein